MWLFKCTLNNETGLETGNEIFILEGMYDFETFMTDKKNCFLSLQYNQSHIPLTETFLHFHSASSVF